MRTKHIDEERWRALIDTDSGEDASDDDDANATESSETSDDEKGEEEENDKITYLDLTKNQVEVVSDPDEEDTGCEYTGILADLVSRHEFKLKTEPR